MVPCRWFLITSAAFKCIFGRFDVPLEVASFSFFDANTTTKVRCSSTRLEKGLSSTELARPISLKQVCFGELSKLPLT